MSTHPNVILLLTLKPDELSRKTLRAIRDEAGIDDDGSLKIGDHDYHVSVMETDYDDGYQISSDEGDIIIFDMITYGYGEKVEWSKLVSQKDALEVWASAACERHKCSAKIFITANYW